MFGILNLSTKVKVLFSYPIGFAKANFANGSSNFLSEAVKTIAKPFPFGLALLFPVSKAIEAVTLTFLSSTNIGNFF